MPETQFALLLIKELGFPALLFIIWFLYHRSESAKWMQFMEQTDSKYQQQIQLLQKLIDTREKANDQQFELLKSTIETIDFHSNILGRIENKIDTNQHCPLIRKEKGS